jgi:hypothetical protein
MQGEEFDAVGPAAAPDDLAQLALVMAADERQLEAISHVHRVIGCDPRPAGRDVKNMTLVFGQTIVGRDPSQPLVQLPSRLALYLCPRLNNSHQVTGRCTPDSPGDRRGSTEFDGALVKFR